MRRSVLRTVTPARRLALASACTLFATLAPASGQVALDEPILTKDGLVYPDGAAIPRGLTDAERRYIETYPLFTQRGSTPPPEGHIECAAEYEPMDAIIFSWNGSPSWTSIIAQMARHITTTGGADVVVYATSTSNANAARNAIQAQGADMSRVRTLVRSTNSIWMRDYGPRYIYEGDVRAVIDHTYNRPRPSDNALPIFHASVFNHAYYEIPLVHGGGNFHLDANDTGFTTRLINNENPGLTEPQIHQLWADYQGLDTLFYNPLPSSIDATQHIDMWVQVISDTDVMVSDWPLQQGSAQDQICETAATDLAARGYTVHRIPAYSTGPFGTHYTFTNVVMCNDLVLIPSYTNSTVVSNNFNQQALAAYQAALPGKTIVQIPCQSLVTAAGVMHCIVMHMPAHRGGDNPTALVRSPNGGESFDPGESVEIRWSTDDRVGVDSVDILLSTNGGDAFTTIVAATADDGSYMWTVPQVGTNNAIVRVVANSEDGDTGHDDSDATFQINGLCEGDINGDGRVDFADLNSVLTLFGEEGAGLPPDLNGDGRVDFADLNLVLNNFGQEC